MKRISIFCGSSLGFDKIYQKQAYLLGKTLALKGIGIVYGGANVGLMGNVADGALQNGGKVIGILPKFLKDKEIAHQNLTELILVETMHERKTRMNDLCDGVIALPGGFGTLEEFFEMLTWGQLGLHKKPMALLNINNFYDTLLALAESMVSTGFLKDANRQMLLSGTTIDEVIKKMENYNAPETGKWINNESV